MFKKGKKINPNTTDTLVGEGSFFEGRVKSEASIRIEGRIHGDIECVGDVTIGEQGVARSNITARNVTIAGKVQGNVTTTGSLTITGTGQLHGNSSSPSLIIAEGGVFHGQSMMVKDEAKAAKQGSADKEKESSSYNKPYSSSASSM